MHLVAYIPSILKVCCLFDVKKNEMASLKLLHFMKILRCSAYTFETSTIINVNKTQDYIGYLILVVSYLMSVRQFLPAAGRTQESRKRFTVFN